MIKESFDLVIQTYNRYAGGGMYLALFFISLIYIYFSPDAKSVKKDLGAYSLFALIIVLFPPAAYIINAVIFDHGSPDTTVFWRTYWIIPIILLIAYCSETITYRQKNKSNKVLIFLSCCAVIVLCGKFLFTSEQFGRSENKYKLPEEAVIISDIIEDDANARDVVPKLAASDSITPYIRQYDAGIKLTYGRAGKTDYGDNYSYSRKIFVWLNDPNYLISPDTIPAFIDYVAQTSTNYLALDDPAVKEIAESYLDLILVDEAGDYSVYFIEQ